MKNLNDPLEEIDAYPTKNEKQQAVDLLLIAVIQIEDLYRTLRALGRTGIEATQLASTGGFLGRKNVTLLIGVQRSKKEGALKTLSKTCRRRTEYMATPLEGAPFHLPLTTAVSVGGATVFILEVERYEEIR